MEGGGKHLTHNKLYTKNKVDNISENIKKTQYYQQSKQKF